MLVSDGDARRQMRKNLMSSNFTQVGVGIGNTSTTGSTVVINFADGFVCDQDACPTIPENEAFDCKGFGFVYGSAGLLAINLSLLVIVMMTMMLVL